MTSLFRPSRLIYFAVERLGEGQLAAPAAGSTLDTTNATQVADALKSLQFEFADTTSTDEQKQGVNNRVFGAAIENLHQQTGGKKLKEWKDLSWDDLSRSELGRILPETPGKRALLEGLKLYASRLNGGTLTAEQIKLADQSLQSLEVIKKSLLNRAAIQQLARDQREDLREDTIVNQFSAGAEQAWESFKDLDTMPKVITGGIIAVGALALWKGIFGSGAEKAAKGEGGGSWLKAVLGLTAIGFGANYLVARGSTDGRGIWDRGESALAEAFGDKRADTSNHPPFRDMLAQLGMEKVWAEEAAVVFDLPVEKALNFLAKYPDKNSLPDETKIRRELGITGVRGWDGPQLHDFLYTAFAKYPESIAQHLTLEEKSVVNAGGTLHTAELMKKWYVDNPFYKAQKRPASVGDVLTNMITRQPPPGKYLQTS